MWKQAFFSQFLNIEFVPPLFQNVGRSTMVKTAIYFAAAAHTTTFDVSDFVRSHGDCLSPMTILLNHLVPAERLAGVQGKVFAIFNQQYLAACFGQETGSYRAARARSNHDDFRINFMFG